MAQDEPLNVSERTFHSIFMPSMMCVWALLVLVLSFSCLSPSSTSSLPHSTWSLPATPSPMSTPRRVKTTALTQNEEYCPMAIYNSLTKTQPDCSLEKAASPMDAGDHWETSSCDITEATAKPSMPDADHARRGTCRTILRANPWRRQPRCASAAKCKNLLSLHVVSFLDHNRQMAAQCQWRLRAPPLAVTTSPACATDELDDANHSLPLQCATILRTDEGRDRVRPGRWSLKRSKAKAKPRRLSTTCSSSRTVLIIERTWIDIEPGTQFDQAYPVAKRLNTLLRLGELPREEDGAIEFWRLKDDLRNDLMHSQHWSDDVWKNMMAGGGGNRKRFQYCTDPSGQEILYLRALQGHSERNDIDPSF